MGLSGSTWEYHRRQYDEWIFPGQVRSTQADSEVEVDSVGDLVDVAIDSGSRVIYDRPNGRLVVIADDTLYVCNRPPSDGPTLDEFH